MNYDGDDYIGAILRGESLKVPFTKWEGMTNEERGTVKSGYISNKARQKARNKKRKRK